MTFECRKLCVVVMLLLATSNLFATTLDDLADDFEFTWTLIDTCCDDIAEKFRQTWTILDFLVAERPIPIKTSLTISQPGVYKVIRDIVGQIIINSDDVDLNLNSHSVTGGVDTISIIDRQNVIVRQGLIKGGTQSCAKVINCNQIAFKDVTFIESGTGLFVQTTTGLVVQHSNFINQQESMLFLDDVHFAKILESSLKFAGELSGLCDIFTAKNSTSLLVEQLAIAGNTCTSFSTLSMMRFDQVMGAIVRNCPILSNNVPYFVATWIEDTKDVEYKNNTISSNFDQLSEYPTVYVFDSENIIIEDCIINRNGSLVDSAAILIENGVDSSIRNCNIVTNYSETSTAIGIFVDVNSQGSTVFGNIVKSNVGPEGSIGIRVDNSSTLVIRNQSQGHSTANFLGNFFQVSVYDTVLGKFFSVADPISSNDNISVVP